jgi:dihydrofolate reductase
VRQLIHLVHTSVDGYIDGPNGEFDWATLGPELADYSHVLTERVDTLLYGRVVWDMMSSYWPYVDATSTDRHDAIYAPYWQQTPKVVFSRTLEKADWNTRVVADDVAGEVAALKAEPGRDLLLTGGSTLAGVLTALGAIDEYHIVVHPVVLGGGRPLFATPTDRLALRLAGSRTFDSRTVLLRYVPATATD